MQLSYSTTAVICALVSAGVHAQAGTGASALSEQDFLAEMPIVLSVSRLAQRLDETPGAMTILDRDFIRMTGARDVVDVLRFVPGFQATSSFETDAPMATYHGRVDDFANRIQVLVDGRSVYSTYLQGSAGVGWQSLAVEDIERIEILRGSNSATYGARAFLGVVNIVSRDVRQTGGVSAWANGGENGMSDQGLRLGWGQGRIVQRISADTRADDGLRRVFKSPDAQDTGANHIDRVNYSALLDLEGAGAANLRAGAVDIRALRGTPGDLGNQARMRSLSAQYVQVDWSKAVSADEDISISVSRTRAVSDDRFNYLSNGLIGGVNYYGAEVSFSAQEVDDALSFQYARRHSPQLQTVAGAELRNEYLYSPSSFDARKYVNTRFTRVFGGIEWRPTPTLVLNAGGLVEDSDIAGVNAAPRLMANWHADEHNSMRAGYSTAFRTPSPYEKYANVRYYNPAGTANLPYALVNGNVSPEKVFVRELGYNLNLPRRGVSADARAYIEQIRNGIGRIQPAYDGSATGAGDFANGDDYDISGFEFQVEWRPASRTRLYFSQSWNQIDVRSLAFPNQSADDAAKVRFKMVHGAPLSAGSLVANQQFLNGYSLTLMYQEASDYGLPSDNGKLFSMARTDLRFARLIKSRFGSTEIAVNLQNLNVPYQDGDKKFYFDRRAFLSLKWDY